MARTVVAIYDDFHTANNAVRELVDSGFPRDNISIIANNQRGEYGYTGGTSTESDTVAGETGAGAGVGAGIGAAIGGIGGLLVGLGALTIPGIGPVIAAGPLAVALSTLTGAGVGAVAGGVTGGLLGALIGLGIPEEEAEYYAEGVRRGGVLVTVQADETNTEHIMTLLNRHNPVDINERAAQWREQGWVSFQSDSGTTSTTAMIDEDDDMVVGTVDQDAPSTMSMSTGVDSPRGIDEEREIWRERTMNQDVSDDFDEAIYRSHYDTNLANTGYPYDHYVPAYRFGYGLASDVRYQHRDWDVIEPDIQRDWELEHPGTWDRFSNAIRHAWEGSPRHHRRERD